MKYLVETFRPAYPDRGVRWKVHSGKTFTFADLHPCVTSLTEVHANGRGDAIAIVIERGAGKNVDAHVILPRPGVPTCVAESFELQTNTS